MNKSLVIGLLVVLVLVVGGGMWWMSSNKTDGAGSTVLEGTDVLPTGMEQTGDTPNETGSEVSNTPAAGTGMVKEFTVEGSTFKFVPAQIRVKKGDTVKVTFKNTGGFHDFVIDEFEVQTSQIGDGDEEEVEFVADKAGTFEYYCSVGNHRQMGMKGSLIVE